MSLTQAKKDMLDDFPYSTRCALHKCRSQGKSSGNPRNPQGKTRKACCERKLTPTERNRIEYYTSPANWSNHKLASDYLPMLKRQLELKKITQEEYFEALFWAKHV